MLKRGWIGRVLFGAAALSSALLSACTVTMGNPVPSPWAVNYPDTAAVTSGRIVRFAGHYGLLGPSPAVLFRDVNGQVSGQVLVWYRAFEPAEAGRRPPADSIAEWGRMQASMRADRARYDSTYGCTSWARGYQEGPAWVCRVPQAHGTPNWAAELTRLDSLVMARRSAEPGGRRPSPVAPPPPPAKPGVTQLRKRDGACMDGGSWSIETRDARGTHTVTSPQPGGGCPQPDGPAKAYDKAGWQMLKEFIAAVAR